MEVFCICKTFQSHKKRKIHDNNVKFMGRAGTILGRASVRNSTNAYSVDSLDWIGTNFAFIVFQPKKKIYGVVS